MDGNIYGLARKALNGAIIGNSLDNTIIDKVYIVGWKSGTGYSTKITNVQSLYATAEEVLYGAIISGIRELFSNGFDSLTASVITTKLSINNDASVTDADSKVRLYINGTNSDAYFINCSNGDKCYINCLAYLSCTNMILTCNGKCYLNCGDYGSANGNNCPSNISGIWYPLTPTNNPTNNPTEYPTREPNGLPTQLPSQQTITMNPSATITVMSNQDAITSTDRHTIFNSSSDDGVGSGSGGGNNNSIEIDATLVLVVVILVVIFCAIIIISLICVYALNRKREYDIEQKKIELDIVKNKNKHLMNNGDNNNKYNNNRNKFSNSKLKGLVNLRTLNTRSNSMNGEFDDEGETVNTRVHIVQNDDDNDDDMYDIDNVTTHGCAYTNGGDDGDDDYDDDDEKNTELGRQKKGTNVMKEGHSDNA